MPAVSIIIPSYNAARYLPNALESCAEQTFTDHEIIVVDDGSTDDTESVVARYPAVHYIRRENGGISAARNTGIAVASGEYLQFLDADDRLHPAKLERCVAVLRSDPGVAVVYTDYEIRTADMSAPYETQRPQWNMPEGGKESMLPALLSQISVPFVPGCPLVHHDWVQRVGGFYDDLRFVEDYPFWIKLAAAGAVFRYIPERLYLYRYTPGSVSRNKLVMAEWRLRAYEKLRTIPDVERYVDLNEVIADRHHLLAMGLWAENRRDDARTHFRAAIQNSARRRELRNILIALSYVVPAGWAERAIKILTRASRP
jgi:glycosyltransferase involved in cell wall biosynthesis